MLGAIIGDVVGSRFEFDRGPWVKEFDLFGFKSEFTDDTVMTMAISEALLSVDDITDYESLSSATIKAMKKWGKAFPNCGFGGRFIRWVLSDDINPYGSFGNGSAMRVSPVGLMYSNITDTRNAARVTSAVTHNHPEGIKGAECTAAVMFLGRAGKTKEEIRTYVEQEFGYDLNKTVDEYRPLHKHDETCMDALPKALVSFLEGVSFEDVIRNAVSLGGDTDTIAAIAGGMAEAFYGVPDNIKEAVYPYLTAEMVDLLDRFYSVI